jgi:hypothetical protein
MIRYALVCSEAHEFEAWFRSASDFEAQSANSLVTCIVCGSASVERALMAPNVVTGRSRSLRAVEEASSPAAPAVPAPLPQPVALAAAPSPEQRAMLEALTELKRKITANADYVGDKFAEEARKMHYGEAPERGIYGQATGEEARALIDEGIEVHALPVLPDEQN